MARARFALASLPLLVACQRLEREDQDNPFASESVSHSSAWDGGELDGGEVDGGDSGTGEPPPIDDTRELSIAQPPPPPITGGGILVLADDSTVVVSDTERDLVHVVDLPSTLELHAITLPAGARPWRAVEMADGTVQVVLRGAGSVVTIDPVAGAITAERSVCRNPRGIAAAPDGDGTLVACASGELWRVPTGDAAGELLGRLDPDLRDVIVGPDGVVRVTRFRSAEVLRLDDDSAVTHRSEPAPFELIGVEEDSLPMRPNTAWRTIALDDSGWLMIHQASRSSPVDANDEEETPYGGLGPCASIVQSTVTIVSSDGTHRSAGAVNLAALPVDVAVDPVGDRIAMVVAASCTLECVLPAALVITSAYFDDSPTQPCKEPMPILAGEPGTQMVAVAFGPGGEILLQQRDPAVLVVLDDYGGVVQIGLEGGSLEDTGHRLFHEVGRAGLACASCHPEGGDDGLVWTIGSDVGHTPALDVGLAGTAPFHWSGDLYDFAALVNEVHLERMGSMIESPERTAAFEAWVTGLRATPPRPADDADAVAGREVFLDLHCDTCHAGEATTNNTSVTLYGGAGPIQVPSLHGVALHPPYFNDGRAATLEQAITEMVSATAPTASPSEAELASLVAYLESL